MQSMLVIGLGDYGRHLCEEITNLGDEVMAVDISEDAVDQVRDIVDSALIADCTSSEVLRSFGIADFDICFVCLGEDFRSNMIIVNALKELGAQYIVSKTNDQTLEKLLIKIGADEVVYPDRDSAKRAAVRYSSVKVHDYYPLQDGFSIYEIYPLNRWIGHSISEIDIREKYETFIVGLKDEEGIEEVMPKAEYIIKENDQLLVLTHVTSRDKLLSELMKEQHGR